MHLKPPLGVMPHYLWVEANPDPTIGELLERYLDVSAAVQRYREAGLEPSIYWLDEMGVFPPSMPR